MAKEKFTVIFDHQPTRQNPNNMVSGGWTQGSVVVEGSNEANAAYLTEEKQNMISGLVKTARVCTVEAESEAEAWSALKKVMGQGVNPAGALVTKSSNLVEEK